MKKTKIANPRTGWLARMADKLFLSLEFDLQVNGELEEWVRALEIALPCNRCIENDMTFKYQCEFQKLDGGVAFELTKTRCSVREDDWGLIRGYFKNTPFQGIVSLNYKIYPGIGYAIQMVIVYLLGIAIAVHSLYQFEHSGLETLFFILILLMSGYGIIHTWMLLFDQRRQLQDYFVQKLNSLPAPAAPILVRACYALLKNKSIKSRDGPKSLSH